MYVHTWKISSYFEFFPSKSYISDHSESIDMKKNCLCLQKTGVCRTGGRGSESFGHVLSQLLGFFDALPKLFSLWSVFCLSKKTSTFHWSPARVMYGLKYEIECTELDLIIQDSSYRFHAIPKNAGLVTLET